MATDRVAQRYALTDIRRRELPDLLSPQIEGFRWFCFQGFREIFEEIFPLKSNDENYELHFKDYKIILPEHTVFECLEKDLDYSATIKGVFEFVNTVKGEIIRQEVYICDLPFMTPQGTFIINGVERIIVSQLVRSPGVYFTTGQKRTASEDAHMMKVIPYRGAWLKYEYDKRKGIYQVRLDSPRRVVKVPITQFLRALGFEIDREGKEIHHPDPKKVEEDEWDNEVFEIKQPLQNTLDEDKTRTKQESQIAIWKKLHPTDPYNDEALEEMLRNRFMDPSRYNLAPVGRYILNRKLNVDIDPDKQTLTEADCMECFRELYKIQEGVDDRRELDDVDHLNLENRRVEHIGELLKAQMRKGLLRIRRIVNERLMQPDAEEETPKDLINTRPLTGVIKEFFGSSQMSQFMDETNPVTSLTHKRRLSALGPKGLTREAARFDFRDVHRSHYGRICPIETPEGPNIGLITSISSFAQINEYGYLETPYHPVEDGQIQLDEVEYLPAFDEVGSRIAPSTVDRGEDGEIEEDHLYVRYEDSFEHVHKSEVDYCEVSPAQFISVTTSLIPFLEHDDANRALMGSNMQRQAVPLVVSERPLVGTGSERKVAEDSGAVLRSGFCGEVTYADSTKIVMRKGIVYDQATGEILDIPNPEAVTNRIAFGSTRKSDINKAVKAMKNYQEDFPSLTFFKNPEDEHEVILSAKKEEILDEVEERLREDRGLDELNRKRPEIPLDKETYEYVFEPPSDQLDRHRMTPIEDRGCIPLEGELEQFETVYLRKFKRSNQGTLINHRPNVREGDAVIKGELLADTSSTDNGELALGKNVMVAFMPWRGYNYEDSILVSEELVKNDTYTSIHIEKHECEARETKLGPESITPELSGYNDEYLRRNLDERGIIRTGAKVNSGDVLVGKRTPKGESDLSGEEKLIRAVFGEKGKGFKNTPLKLPHGEEGIVIETQYFSREEGDELPHNVQELARVFVAKKRKLKVGDKMAGRHGNKGVVANILPEEDMPFLPNGKPVQVVLNPLGVPSRMNIGQTLETHLGLACAVSEQDQAEEMQSVLQDEETPELDRSTRHHELDQEDMELEMANDPLHVMCPVFRSPSEDQIRQLFKKHDIPLDGKTTLHDGLTGEPFKERVVVGVMYLLKLHHLVEKKMHARSTGSYALITQQPLGGKAQFGGQRLGEMEVWALEGYGAAYLLKEMLTIKSDDVAGRNRTYKAIVDGKPIPEPGQPESFNVIVNEIQSLALNVNVHHTEIDQETVAAKVFGNGAANGAASDGASDGAASSVAKSDGETGGEE